MQTIYQKMGPAELDAAISDLEAQVAEVKARGLALDMARGKPSPAQVTSPGPCSTSWAPTPTSPTGAWTAPTTAASRASRSARRLAGEFLGVPTEQTIVLGASSLNIMQSVIVHYWSRASPAARPA